MANPFVREEVPEKTTEGKSKDSCLSNHIWFGCLPKRFKLASLSCGLHLLKGTPLSKNTNLPKVSQGELLSYVWTNLVFCCFFSSVVCTFIDRVRSPSGSSLFLPLGDREGAIAVLMAAKTYIPNESTLYFNLGNMLGQKEEFQVSRFWWNLPETGTWSKHKIRSPTPPPKNIKFRSTSIKLSRQSVKFCFTSSFSCIKKVDRPVNGAMLMAEERASYFLKRMGTRFYLGAGESLGSFRGHKMACVECWQVLLNRNFQRH